MTGAPLSNPAFRALWASRSVSFVGDGITTTVLVLLTAPRDGPAGVGLLLLAHALPRLGGPLAGVLADRVRIRRLMMSCELASAAIIGVIAIILPPLPVLVGLVAVAGCLATIRNPAGRSLVPVLVAPADRAPANALFGLALTLQLAVGPGLGGLLAAGPGGIRTALVVDAATFVVSALLLVRLPSLAPARDPAAITGVWADATAGLRYVVTHRQIRVLVLTLFLVVAFAGVDNVALVFLTGDELAAGPAGYGLAVSAFGVGMALASVASARLARGRSPVALLIGATAATGAGILFTGLAPGLAAVVAAQLIAGAGNAVQNIGYDTVVQDLVPRPLLGRVFGTVGAAAQLGAGVAYAAGGLLVGLIGARATLVLAGVGTFAVLLVLVPALRRPGPPTWHAAGMRIVVDDLSGPGIAALLDEHLRDMRATSPPESVHALDLDGLRGSAVTVWSVLDGEQVVGCGALKVLDAGHGELKSMRTAATHRGRGIGTAMLRHIVAEARGRGMTRLSLETGPQDFFAPARALYVRHGFVPCPPFDGYAEDPSSRYFTSALD